MRIAENSTVVLHQQGGAMRPFDKPLPNDVSSWTVGEFVRIMKLSSFDGDIVRVDVFGGEET